MVDNGNVGLGGGRDRGDFFDLAAAHQGRGVGFGTMLLHFGRNAGSSADHQLAEFRQM